MTGILVVFEIISIDIMSHHVTCPHGNIPREPPLCLSPNHLKWFGIGIEMHPKTTRRHEHCALVFFPKHRKTILSTGFERTISEKTVSGALELRPAAVSQMIWEFDPQGVANAAWSFARRRSQNRFVAELCKRPNTGAAIIIK